MSDHESTYVPRTGIEKWLDSRLPIGVAGIPVGAPGMPYFDSGAAVRVEAAE